MLPHRSAAREALEEAGVVGDVADVPVAEFSISKHPAGGEPLEVRVQVFALAVASELQRWPEDGVRDRKWVLLAQAMEFADPSIRKVLALFRSKHEIS